MLTGKTKNIGVIGCPIEHSLSPLMQNIAITDSGLDYAYTAMLVHPHKLKEAIKGLQALNYRGVNVTIPHKIEVISLLDEIDENAKMIGAVNTILFEDNLIKGFNTDASGFINSLYNHKVKIKDEQAVLLGAGGAARAVIWGLIKAGIKSIVIGVRNPLKVQPLVDAFKDYLAIEAQDWTTDAFQSKLTDMSLLINATPLGMHPNLEEKPPIQWNKIKNRIVVYDLIYNPSITKFLSEAQQSGHKIMNGAEMLVEQGAESFKIWTGIMPNTKKMLQVL